jgi:hypothetical protein
MLLLSKQGLIQLFKDSQGLTSNKASLKNLCKRHKIEYPFTADHMALLPILEIVSATRNPNSHNYPIGPPIMVIGRIVHGKELREGPANDCTCQGTYPLDNHKGSHLNIGNWLPANEHLVHLTPRHFLDTMRDGAQYTFNLSDIEGRCGTTLRALIELLFTKYSDTVYKTSRSP